ncbi:MAG: hypothetical protein K0R63_698 [Rickettsiales bacterium]|jgi:prepilin-type N-terminal cleavage/methylation domain-containing protein|nr:hypothetical protein [Rickettsiales bacterium]
MLSSRRLKQGFTLVEMSIVLTIIGLLIGAVIGGLKVKRSLEVNQAMEGITTLREAIATFKKRYNGLPGDLWNAQTLFGTTNTSNGNGDGLLTDTSADNLRFFQHLSLAGVIAGAYDGATIKPGVGLMAGSIRGSAYSIVSLNSSSHYLFFSKFRDTDGDGAIEWIFSEDALAVLTPQEMWKIDTENDDGNPAAGRIQSFDGSDVTAGSCVTGGAYNLSYKSDACVVQVQLNE